jgi:hypothetical protein
LRQSNDFLQSAAGPASLPALRTYKCDQCGVPLTETEEDPSQKLTILKMLSVSPVAVANDNGPGAA